MTILIRLLKSKMHSIMNLIWSEVSAYITLASNEQNADLDTSKKTTLTEAKDDTLPAGLGALKYSTLIIQSRRWS